MYTSRKGCGGGSARKQEKEREGETKDHKTEVRACIESLLVQARKRGSSPRERGYKNASVAQRTRPRNERNDAEKERKKRRTRRPSSLHHQNLNALGPPDEPPVLARPTLKSYARVLGIDVTPRSWCESLLEASDASLNGEGPRPRRLLE